MKGLIRWSKYAVLSHPEPSRVVATLSGRGNKATMSILTGSSGLELKVFIGTGQ